MRGLYYEIKTLPVMFKCLHVQKHDRMTTFIAEIIKNVLII